MIRYVSIILSTLLILSLAHISWAQDLILKQAIDEALQNNLEILAAKREIQAKGADFWQGISPDNPQFFSELEAIPKNQHSLADYGERKIGIKQELDFPIIYLFKGQLFQAEKRRAIAEYALVRNEVAADVKKKFYEVLLFSKQVELFQQVKSLTTELYQKALIRVETGESAKYDAIKVKVDLAEVENRLLAIQKKYDIATNELALLLGRKNNSALSVSGDLNYFPFQIELDSVKFLAERNHPQLKSGKEHLSQVKINKTLAWLKVLPSLELSYFQQDFQYEPTPKAWGAEIGLSVPLWFFLKDQGQIRSAHHQLAAARWGFEFEKRKIILRVNQAYANLILAEKQVHNYQKNVLQQVEELVRIATRSYEEGEMGYLEVTEALRTLNRTKAGYLEALFEYLAEQAELEKAVGMSLFAVEE